LTARGDTLLGKDTTQQIILAVVIQGTSVRLEGTNDRCSFGTVQTDRKKTSLGSSKWRIKNYGGGGHG